jgi:hypothetical protein
MSDQAITADVLNPLLVAVDDPNTAIRIKVLKALAVIETLNVSNEARAKIGERLTYSLHDADPKYRLSAAIVLGSVGNSLGLTELLIHIVDPDGSQRLEIAKCLSLLALPSTTHDIREAFRLEKDQQIRSWLALALAHAGTTAEIEAIVAARDSGSESASL